MKKVFEKFLIVSMCLARCTCEYRGKERQDFPVTGVTGKLWANWCGH